MSNIMVDLETLSTQPDARILAIGAVKFMPGAGVYERFYQVVTPPDADALTEESYDFEGFHVSAETMSWWARQSAEARAVFIDPNSVTLPTALVDFARWAQTDSAKSDICVWGNGASFDNVILSTAYRICELQQPWEFWNDRCYRTMKNMNKHVTLNRLGTHHNALNDAESQAEHLLSMEVL